MFVFGVLGDWEINEVFYEWFLSVQCSSMLKQVGILFGVMVVQLCDVFVLVFQCVYFYDFVWLFGCFVYVLGLCVCVIVSLCDYFYYRVEFFFVFERYEVVYCDEGSLFICRFFWVGVFFNVYDVLFDFYWYLNGKQQLSSCQCKDDEIGGYNYCFSFYCVSYGFCYC